MICILALIVFGIMGIFSATHRKVAAEAFDCVFRRMTLRKCQTGLDTKLKSQITGKIMKRSPRTAKFVYRYFEVFSWALVVLMILSLGYSIYGGYNYYLYGNCNGPNNDGFCIFDPTGENGKVSSPNEEVCSVHPVTAEDLTIDGVDFSLFQQIETGSEDTVVFVGCYACDYTREVIDSMKKLQEKYKPNLIWMHFPVKGHTDYLSKYGYCVYQQNPNEFWKFHYALFDMDSADVTDVEKVKGIITGLDINMIDFSVCLVSDDTTAVFDKQIEALKKTKVYGTPTVFINGEPIVGPKPYRVYKRMLN